MYGQRPTLGKAIGYASKATESLTRVPELRERMVDIDGLGVDLRGIRVVVL